MIILHLEEEQLIWLGTLIEVHGTFFSGNQEYTDRLLQLFKCSARLPSETSFSDLMNQILSTVDKNSNGTY